MNSPSAFRWLESQRRAPPPSACLACAGEADRDQDAPFLERLKPILIDQIMLQMGWPIVGLRVDFKDVLALCGALFLAQWRFDWLSLPGPCAGACARGAPHHFA